jgi:hypothetical protein
MPPAETLARIAGYVEFIKGYVLRTYFDRQRNPSNISDVGYTVVEGLGQPGLYLDGKLGTRVYWAPQLKQYNIEYQGGKIVLIKEIATERADDQYWGVIFHEFGHAGMDKIGRNGSAEAENNAWAVELMSLEEYIRDKPTLKEPAKQFVKARRAAKMYSAFKDDWRSQARAAYKAISGEDLP